MADNSILAQVLGQAGSLSDALFERNKLRQQAELEKQRLAEQARHNKASEESSMLSAKNLGAYHNAVASDLAERRLLDKYKALGVGADGKALGAEAQKSKNLLTAAENSMGNTQRLIDENKGAALVEKILPNSILSIIGGKPKEIMDSKSVTKEGLQNYATGAAASGEQVPAFQSWSGPGLADIIRGNTGMSPGMSDTFKTLKSGYDKPQRQVGQQDIDFLKLGNDPAARALVQSRQNPVQIPGAAPSSVASPAPQFDPSMPLQPTATPEQKAARLQYLRMKQGQ